MAVDASGSLLFTVKPAGDLVPVLQVGVHLSGRAHWDDGVDPAHRGVPVLLSVSSGGVEPRCVGLPDDRDLILIFVRPRVISFKNLAGLLIYVVDNDESILFVHSRKRLIKTTTD
jgi:hypothetical protein